MHRVLVIVLSIIAAANAADGVLAYASDIKPLIDTHCAQCHGGETTRGGLDLARIADDVDAARDPHLWRAVLIKLGSGEMPPAKKPQPSADERALIARYVTQMRARTRPDPGRPTIHRLNRAEYENTVRDLCGIDLDPTKDFPADDVGQGFDNIADVLSLPPLLVEKYLAAADAVLAKAITDERLSLHVEAERMAAVKGGQPFEAAADAAARTFDDAGETWHTLRVSADGKHTLKVRAWAVNGGAEPASLMLKVDEQPVKTFPVKASEKSATTLTATVDLAPGERRIAVAFINPLSADEAAGIAPTEKGANAKKPPAKKKPADKPAPAPVAAKPAKPIVRTLSVDWVEVLGPSVGVAPESHKRIMIAKPSETVTRREAARQVVERFASRAWRRPAEAADVERLLTLVDKAEAAGESFENGVRLALKAVLVSPRFLFRIERDQPGTGGVHKLDDWDLASRLSYFLWSSMPDDELFACASAGTLSQPEVLAQQVRRMLASPKSRALVDNFASQWLGLRRVAELAPDAKLFPEYDKALVKAMVDEATAFVDHVMREDRSVLEFLDCDYVFVNDRLARHYGMAAVAGAKMKKMPASDRARGGVLGMAAVLASTSNPNRTSLVKRGKFILESLLGDPTDPPPPDVEDLPEQSAPGNEGLSLRQILEKHREQPDCKGCHERLDPLGFGLEGFDPIGRVRHKDGAAAIDTAGALPSGKAFNGPAELKAILLATRSGDFVRCLAEKMLIYALGRGLEPTDDAAIAALVERMQANGNTFSTLVQGIVASHPFQYRRMKDSP
ncbi:MAG TPA: DUF1592 domain-containing protein [Planctomycetota bacterium]|nr:DUF1592 domain-containing protein [Planctomycetota bacterium]